METSQTTERKTESKLSYNKIEDTLGVTGKLTPQAVEFEEAVLGAMMIDVNAVGETVDMLESKMFYRDKHQVIYDAIRDLFKRNEPVDLLTVTSELRKKKKLEFVGGPSYLAFLTNRVASAANIEYHARVVIEKYVLRELIANCNETIKKAYDESNDVLEVLDNAEERIYSIAHDNFKSDSKLLSYIVEQAVDELEEMKKDANKYSGVPTGLNSLDSKIGGWHNSNLIIIAARPGMGKTSLVLTLARNAAIDFGMPVALFSLEMSAKELAYRLFAIESGINSERITRGQLDETEWIQLMDKIRTIENNDNLIIDDTPALSVFDLRAKARRLQSKYGIKLIIVDYLQLMQGQREGEKTKGNREQEISYISRSLKALAKELKVPVIALSQLSRNVELRGGSHRPELADLRESGAIEQDADMVIFIYRPEKYGFDHFDDKDNTPSHGLAELMIKKNRHGSVADVKVRFIEEFTKFADIDDTLTFNNPSVDDNPNAGISANVKFESIQSRMNDDQGDDGMTPAYFGSMPTDNGDGVPF